MEQQVGKEAICFWESELVMKNQVLYIIVSDEGERDNGLIFSS